MGERKGQNFYYPPDFDYKKHKSLNHYHGTHALRERAKKIDQGILVIRFEMPFNIWCLGCHNHVGMGVRYNAEKKKIGMYYTTPLYEFRMKCHLCDNYYVIRTDPKNFDYELVEGCSRQEKRYDPSTIDQLGAVDREFSQKLAADAMFKTEHQEEDKNKALSEESRMDKIEWVQERLRDDFAANQALRAQFRREKKDLSEKRVRDDDLRGRVSLNIPLVAEDHNDGKVAAMLTRYRTVKSYDERQTEKREEITSRRIFDAKPSTSLDNNNSNSSATRLTQSLKQDRNKKINEKFDIGPSVKKSPLALGIVKRKSVKDEYEEIQSTDKDLVLSIEHTTPLKKPKEEDIDIPDSGKMSLGLVTDYGSSSDSE